MKTLLILASLLAVSIAQLPGYLSGPVGYPGLASRFKDDNSTAAPTPSVNNRLGETSGTTQKIPIDARGDVNLVNRLNQWPREHRPFWVLNAEHIEQQRNTQGSQGTNIQSRLSDDIDDFGNPIQTQTIRPVQTRGSFAGSV